MKRKNLVSGGIMSILLKALFSVTLCTDQGLKSIQLQSLSFKNVHCSCGYKIAALIFYEESTLQQKFWTTISCLGFTYCWQDLNPIREESCA